MKKTLLSLLALFLFAGCAARPAHAQFIGYVSPQTVQQTLANGVACTGINQIFNIMNLGQNQHSATIAVSAGTTSAAVFIQGQDAAGDVFPISDTVFSVHTFASTPAVTASGYFPIVSVVVNCTGGTFTLNYAGTWGQANVLAGSYLNGAVDKAIYQGASQGSSTLGTQFVPPFSSTYGELVFQYATAAVTGSSITVSCATNATAAFSSTYAFTLAAVTTVQTFAVPSTFCPLMTVKYTSGGASANTYALDYILGQLGQIPQSNLYTHITGTTATVVKAGPGTVHSLVVGTSAAGTISFFDLASASCTGTPATNVVSVITEFASAAPPPPFYLYDVMFNNGICVKASAAMDFTVSAQ